jgi:light-regulated signal transduction histidine kinase (bacteriophytochrome)
MNVVVKLLGRQLDPRIEIGIRCDGGARVFTVQDNGLGIDPRYHERGFELFEIESRVDVQGEGG